MFIKPKKLTDILGSSVNNITPEELKAAFSYTSRQPKPSTWTAELEQTDGNAHVGQKIAPNDDSRINKPNTSLPKHKGPHF
jgi:hypothetical protein